MLFRIQHISESLLVSHDATTVFLIMMYQHTTWQKNTAFVCLPDLVCTRTKSSMTYWIIVMYFLSGSAFWASLLIVFANSSSCHWSGKKKKPMKTTYMMVINSAAQYLKETSVLSRNMLFLPCGHLCWVLWAGGKDQRSGGSSQCWLETVSFQPSTGSRQSSPSPKRMVLQQKRDIRIICMEKIGTCLPRYFFYFNQTCLIYCRRLLPLKISTKLCCFV